MWMNSQIHVLSTWDSLSSFILQCYQDHFYLSVLLQSVLSYSVTQTSFLQSYLDQSPLTVLLRLVFILKSYPDQLYLAVLPRMFFLSYSLTQTSFILHCYLDKSNLKLLLPVLLQ